MANAPAAVGPDVQLGMAPDILQQFLKRQKNAQTIAYLWASLFEACYYYAIPQRNRYWRPKQFQGEIRATRIYDTTAVEATKTFVSKLHDAMTPPGVQWAFLMLDDQYTSSDIQEVEDAQMALDDYMRKLFNYIHSSNFDVAINECYFDLAIGTSCLVINQGNDKVPLMFTSIPIDKLCIEEAANSKIESWYRTWDLLKISELQTRWKKIDITQSMAADVSQDPDAKIRVIYEGVSYFPNRPKPYLYAVWSSEAILYSEELESNPGIVWRFQKTNNEMWGRGCVMDALPSIISLNEMARIELASANLNTFRPYMGFSDAVFNPHTFKLEPFTVIPIAPIGSGGQVPLIPLPDSSNPQFGEMKIADLRMQINRLLYADTPSDSQSVQPPTAYELSIKQQELAQKIGPLFSRLQQEFLEPVVMRIGYILDKMGLLPKPKMDGNPVRFKYKSPLALAKGQQDIARLTQFIQLMQGIMGPDITQLYINPKTTPYLIANSLQVDTRYLNSPDDVATAMQAMQDKQSQLDQAQIQGAGQQTAPVPKEGAALQPFQQ